MHAVSRDPAAFARPCVYLQLDEGSQDMCAEEEGEEEEEPTAELRLIPAQDSDGEQRAWWGMGAQVMTVCCGQGGEQEGEWARGTGVGQQGAEWRLRVTASIGGCGSCSGILTTLELPKAGGSELR